MNQHTKHTIRTIISLPIFILAFLGVWIHIFTYILEKTNEWCEELSFQK